MQNHLIAEVVFLFLIISPVRLVRITNKYLCSCYSAITRSVLRDNQTSPLLLYASEYPLHEWAIINLCITRFCCHAPN